MATRFYFRESGTAPVSPAVDAAWEESASPFDRKPMFTTSDGADTLTTVSGFSSTSGNERAHRQLISEPMESGHIFNTGVTYKAQLQVLESNADDNLACRLGIRIVSEDGATVRHTVKTVANYSTGEWNTLLRNKPFIAGGAGVGSYTTVTGDRLVVEFGHVDSAGTSPDGSSRWGSAGTGDLPEDSTNTATDLRPWFETTLDLTFVAAGPSTTPPGIPFPPTRSGAAPQSGLGPGGFFA